MAGGIVSPKEDKIFALNKGVISTDYYPDQEIIERVRNDRGIMEWIPSRKILDEKSEQQINVITVIKPVPQYRYGTIAAAIVNIDERYLSNIIGSIVTGKELELFILNGRDNVVSRNYKNKPMDITGNMEYLSGVFSGMEGHYIQKMNGEKVLVSFITSDVNDWKYISIIPYNVIIQKITFIKDYAIIISLLGILLGIIVSLFFSNRIYKPIRTLAGMFWGNESENNLLIIPEHPVHNYHHA